ncbi:uncharacterized protein DNG_07356 [Cephalotrichum gorgonifer]|uniref:Uncharacterized protein n=1 Tax=Cephalotrichum gorgonifer TaxID=2041049 RepID=A0AAE8N1F0_9PEZI|nr:uncharacterized protein DNG_07356 [Cephalotrichum gorgonifer]
MKLQLTILALAASTAQVMAVPLEEQGIQGKSWSLKGKKLLHTNTSAAFDTKPTDKTVESASAAAEDAVVPAACYWCPSPCAGYYCCDGPVPYCGYLTNPFECVCWGPA